MKRNTELSVDLKTLLHYDRIARLFKAYDGTLLRDREDHFTFIEAPKRKRNYYRQVYKGKYITVTNRKGQLQPNFKELKTDGRFNLLEYVTGVALELFEALYCLIVK